MQCPTCKDITLVMADRQGIEIDYCPQCRGVWLDRGELDKIIERSASVAPDTTAPHDRDHRNRPREYEREGLRYKRKKPKSFLGDIFDF